MLWTSVQQEGGVINIYQWVVVPIKRAEEDHESLDLHIVASFRRRIGPASVEEENGGNECWQP